MRGGRIRKMSHDLASRSRGRKLGEVVGEPSRGEDLLIAVMQRRPVRPDKVVGRLGDDGPRRHPLEIGIHAHNPLARPPQLRLMALEPHEAWPIFLAGANEFAGALV